MKKTPASNPGIQSDYFITKKACSLTRTQAAKLKLLLGEHEKKKDISLEEKRQIEALKYEIQPIRLEDVSLKRQRLTNVKPQEESF